MNGLGPATTAVNAAGSARSFPISATAGIAADELSLGLRAATERYQRQFVEAALRASGGSMSAAARLAGMDRSNFHRLFKRLTSLES